MGDPNRTINGMTSKMLFRYLNSDPCVHTSYEFTTPILFHDSTENLVSSRNQTANFMYKSRCHISIIIMTLLFISNKIENIYT